MELFSKIPHIHFMKQRHKMGLLSIFLFIISLFFLFTKGINLGLDFTGGTQLELQFSKPYDTETLQTLLERAGIKNAKVTHFGSSQDILIRLANRSHVSDVSLGKQVLTALKASDPNLKLKRIEFVGSEVGEYLIDQGLLAILLSFLAIMVYVAIRFEYRFAVSAVIALLHDPILILGFFSACQIEFDLATLAAILAVIGYSLNDTIVVFDRVRENFRKVRKGTSAEIMDLSINQTLSRTIMTSVLTLLVVVALFLFGGETLRGFSTALMIGIIVGTYSSIFIAGALAVSMGLSKKDWAVIPKKEFEELP